MGSQLNFTDDVASHLVIQTALGLVPGHAGWRLFGEGAIGTTAADVWHGGGLYPFPVTAAQLSVVSTSANDTSLGTGARHVIIIGLDANWKTVSEHVNLNGLTPVVTTNSFLRVNRVYVHHAGSGGGAAGTITVRHSGNLLAQLDGVSNQALQAIFTVPDDKVAMLLGWVVSCDKGKEVHVYGKTRTNVDTAGPVWRYQKGARIYQTVESQTYPVPVIYPPRTDIRIEAVSDTPGADVHAELSMLLIDRGNVAEATLATLLTGYP